MFGTYAALALVCMYNYWAMPQLGIVGYTSSYTSARNVAAQTHHFGEQEENNVSQ